MPPSCTSVCGGSASTHAPDPRPLRGRVHDRRVAQSRTRRRRYGSVIRSRETPASPEKATTSTPQGEGATRGSDASRDPPARLTSHRTSAAHPQTAAATPRTMTRRLQNSDRILRRSKFPSRSHASRGAPSQGTTTAESGDSFRWKWFRPASTTRRSRGSGRAGSAAVTHAKARGDPRDGTTEVRPRRRSRRTPAKSRTWEPRAAARAAGHGLRHSRFGTNPDVAAPKRRLRRETQGVLEGSSPREPGSAEDEKQVRGSRRRSSHHTAPRPVRAFAQRVQTT